jgi:hypothetical protein
MLMSTRFGVPTLPSPKFDRNRFVANAQHLFGEVSDVDAGTIWTCVEAAAEQKKGTMVVISRHAAEEAKRLATQATPIAPQALSPALVRQLTGIDGAVLQDAHGVCHAIGVILDGQATDEGNPAQGARYNSAIRYVTSAAGDALAIIISEDGSFDIRPLLPPHVLRSEVEQVVADLQTLVGQDERRAFPDVRRRLQRLRFYFDEEQCARVNADLGALQTKMISAGDLWVVLSPFRPDEAMNDRFFLPE